MVTPDKNKKLIPQAIEDKKTNNYLFMKYPYLLLWREDDKQWFPLPTDRMDEEELSKLDHFIKNKYLMLNTKSLSLEELAEDLGVYLKGVVSSENIALLQKFILESKMETALN